MKRSLKLATAIAALLSLPSAYAVVCTNFPADTQDPNQGYVATLGIGIDSERGNRIKPLSCLNFTTRQAGTPSATYELLMTRSLEEYMSSVSKTRGGGFKIFGFGFGKSKTITSIHLQKRYSSTLVLDYSAYLGSRIIEIDGNTPLTNQANLVRNDYCKFKQQCGDEVVMQQEEGASVKFVLRFSFSSESYSTGFNSNFNLGFSNPAVPIPGTSVVIPKDSISFSLSRMTANASSSLKNNGRVEVFAFQEGGDVLALGRALGATNHNENAPIVECGLNNLAACDAAMSKIINYVASDEFIDGVKNQPAQLATHTRKLTEIDVTLPDSFRESEVTPAIAQAREDLQNEYLQRYEDFLRAEETLQLSLSPTRSQQVRMLRDSLGNEIAAIQAAALGCYSDLANCAAQTQQTLAGLQGYDRAVVLPNTADGLVAYYPFNANALDESGNGNDGVVYGATLTTDRNGKLNNAYNFNGIDNKMLFPTVGNNYLGSNDFSISLFLKMNSTTGSSSLLSKREICNHHPFFNILNAGTTTTFEIDGNLGAASYTSFDVTNNLAANQWRLISIVRKGNIVSAYIDGQLNQHKPTNGVLDISNNAVLGISNNPCTALGMLNGSIDDIRIYNRALTAAEIQQLYQTTESKINQAPLALFTASAIQGAAPLTVNLNASAASDADGSIVSYQWQTDKGQTADGKTATLTFPQAGTYQLTLTVTDDQGATSQAVKTITVEAAAAQPANLSVQVTGNGSVTGNGISCGTDCSESFPQGSSVTLTASPDKDTEFVGWQGVAGCFSNTTCVVNLSADVQATAVFQAVGNTGGTGNTSGTCKLTNISSRLNVQGGANDGYAGFMLSGSGTQKVLLRGIAVDGGTDPIVQLLKHNGKSWDLIYNNDEWENDSNANALRNLAQNYQLPDRNGNDAGVLLNLEAGLYTAQLSSGGRSGSQVIGVDALNEAGATLVNISTRAYVSGGANDLFAGFAISGNNCSLPVLLRGIAVDSGTNPALTLLKLNGAAWDKVASNDAWQTHSSASQIRALASNMQLPDRNGNDAGMLLNLEPGVYSLQLSSGGLAGLMTVGVDAQ